MMFFFFLCWHKYYGVSTEQHFYEKILLFYLTICISSWLRCSTFRELVRAAPPVLDPRSHRQVTSQQLPGGNTGRASFLWHDRVIYHLTPLSSSHRQGCLQLKDHLCPPPTYSRARELSLSDETFFPQHLPPLPPPAGQQEEEQAAQSGAALLSVLSSSQ